MKGPTTGSRDGMDGIPGDEHPKPPCWWARLGLTVLVLIIAFFAAYPVIKTIHQRLYVSVHLDSQPQGATVKVGNALGVLIAESQTPCDLTLRKGTYRFSFKLAGYRPRDIGPQEVPATWYEEPTVLCPRNANLVIVAKPAEANATVSIDGKTVDPDPGAPGVFSRQVSPNDHALLIKAEGYHTLDRDVKANPGETIPLECPLAAIRLADLHDFYAYPGYTIDVWAPLDEDATCLWTLGTKERPGPHFKETLWTESVKKLSLRVTTNDEFNDAKSTACTLHISDNLKASGHEDQSVLPWVNLKSAEVALTPRYEGCEYLGYEISALLRLYDSPDVTSANLIFYRVELELTRDGQPISEAAALVWRRDESSEGGSWFKEWQVKRDGQWVTDKSESVEDFGESPHFRMSALCPTKELDPKTIATWRVCTGQGSDLQVVDDQTEEIEWP